MKLTINPDVCAPEAVLITMFLIAVLYCFGLYKVRGTNEWNDAIMYLPVLIVIYIFNFWYMFVR